MIFGRLLVILALFSLSGLDRALIQSYAWATMINDRTPELGLSEAFDSTFSGDHPCQLCLAIADAAQKDQEKPPLENSSEPKPKIFSASLSTQLITLSAARLGSLLPGFDGPADRSIILELPTPPPRWV